MNVFAPFPCPVASARALCDRHVVKMVLETAQILSTAARLRGVEAPESGEGRLYRPTHAAHPCVRHTAAHAPYAAWVADHGAALSAEYTRRYDRTHGSAGVLLTATLALGLEPGCADPSAVHDWPQAMPDECRDADPHLAYRRYLAIKYAGWARRPRWTSTEPPVFYPHGQTR